MRGLGSLTTPEPVWRLNPLVALHWRDWGGDAVVYEACSGQTHKLDPLTAAVVARLADQPESTAGLCTYLDDTVDAGERDQLSATLLGVLDRLHTMGWLQTTRP